MKNNIKYLFSDFLFLCSVQNRIHIMFPAEWRGFKWKGSSSSLKFIHPFILWILASPNLHKLSICSLIYSSIHTFCKIALWFYYVLSITLVTEDKIILEKIVWDDKRNLTFSKTLSKSSCHLSSFHSQSFCFLGGREHIDAGWIQAGKLLVLEEIFVLSVFFSPNLPRAK